MVSVLKTHVVFSIQMSSRCRKILKPCRITHSSPALEKIRLPSLGVGQSLKRRADQTAVGHCDDLLLARVPAVAPDSVADVWRYMRAVRRSGHERRTTFWRRAAAVSR
jgi:hypothetical protein